MDREPRRYQYVLVACARWEKDSIIEWIEYHRSIGFDHFYIYSNDDDWKELYNVLRPYIFGQRPLVTYIHWPRVGEQIPIYIDYINEFKNSSEWACLLDIDEFIVLKDCDRIDVFMSDFENFADCIYFNWINYGNNGYASREKRSALTSLTRRSRGIDVHTKTIFRTSRVDPAVINANKGSADLPLTHFWHSYPFEHFRMCNVLGDDVGQYCNDFPINAQCYLRQDGLSQKIVDKAYIAHFMFQSEDDFLRRTARGGFPAQSIWKERYERGEHHAILEGLNEIEDFYLRDYWYKYTESSVEFRS